MLANDTVTLMPEIINMTKEIPQYCGKGLDDFHSRYNKIHGYASLLVCIFGSIANSLNIVVLTRREMRSPTNAILTGLAIADLLVMIDYIPYAFYNLPHLNLSKEQRLSYAWAWYVLFHAIFAQIMHTISIWLTVTLAVWRYIAVGYPQKNRLWCSMQRTLMAIASSYIVCPLLGIQLYLSLRIKDSIEPLDQFGNAVNMTALTSENNTDNVTVIRNVTLYQVHTSHLAESSKHLLNFNFWIYSVVIKLIPCIALTILSLRLIGALLEAKRRRKQLISNSSTMKQLSTGNGAGGAGEQKSMKKRKNSKTLEKERQTDRTTRMLLAVLLLFLLTEFPQGILGLLNALLEKPFFYNCYLKLGDLMDILALINSAINFILYCAMSRQFRTTFNILFRPKILDRWLPLNQNEDDLQFGRTDGGGKDNNGQTHVTQLTQV